MAPRILISPRVREKLVQKHDVSVDEIGECFANRTGRALIDTREEHATDPPTMWLVAETDHGRHLKIVFIQHATGDFTIKTAHPANDIEKATYLKHGM